MSREVELIALLESGSKVPLKVKGVTHFAWYVPKEDFGWKHTRTFSPIVSNSIYRASGDLVISLNEFDKDWEIDYEYQEPERTEETT